MEKIQNFKCKDLPSKKYVDSMEENLMKETSRSICKDICSTSDEVLDMAGNTDKIEAENKMLKEAYMKLMGLMWVKFWYHSCKRVQSQGTISWILYQSQIQIDQY